MSLESILAEYNENSKNASSGGGQVDMSKYFSTFLKQGVNEGIKTVRLLPGKDGATPFTTIHIHTKKVGNQWRKFVCPKHEKNDDCPFCEAYDLINAKGTEEQKKTSYVYRAKKAYVMRLIDRDNEGEGVKFWRVNHNSKKSGYYDSIISLFKLYAADLSNPDNGRDLAISIERNDKDIPTVTNIIARDVSPLSADKEEAHRWLSTTETWEDVYKIKSYDYLKILVMGEEPEWDNVSKTYVAKGKANATPQPSQNFNGDLEKEITMGGSATTAAPTTPQPQSQAPEASVPQSEPVQSAPQSKVDEDEEDDDLPF
jgi:hypothetical protein